MNKELRKQCKILKAIQGVSYKEIAEYLEIKTHSFYCWINGYYDLSHKKAMKLKEILIDLTEV